MKPAATSRGKKNVPLALQALRRSAKKAVELGLTTGTPAYVLEDGQIVDAAKRTREARNNRGRA
jgi:hypothetical protein